MCTLFSYGMLFWIVECVGEVFYFFLSFLFHKYDCCCHKGLPTFIRKQCCAVERTMTLVVAAVESSFDFARCSYFFCSFLFLSLFSFFSVGIFEMPECRQHIQHTKFIRFFFVLSKFAQAI